MLLSLCMTAWIITAAVAQNPGTLYIPLTVDGNDKYTVQVNMVRLPLLLHLSFIFPLRIHFPSYARHLQLAFHWSSFRDSGLGLMP